MKVTILPLLLVALFAGVPKAFSQDYIQSYGNNELQVSIGMLNTSNIIWNFSDLFADEMIPGTTWENTMVSTTYNIAYRYFLSDRVGVGACVAFGTEQSDGVVNATLDGHLHRFNTTLAGEFKYNYMNYGYFKLYGLAGAGVLYLHQSYAPLSRPKEDNSICYFDFQLSPVGVKVGTTFGGFAELGFGYRGVLNVGVYLEL